MRHIDWVIVGGESGPQARPTHVEWIRSIVKQCQEARVPVFVKQLGACAFADRMEPTYRGWRRVDDYYVLELRDPKGGAPDEWPTDLRVREFPIGA